MPLRLAVLASQLRDRGMIPATVISLGLWRAVDGDHSEAMWMSREGLAVLAGTPLIHADSWSWASRPWNFVPTSPAWEIVCAWLWQLAGVWGFAILSFLVTVSALTVLAWASRVLGASRTATVVAIVVTGILCSEVLTSRAGVPAFTLLVLQFLLLWRLRARLRASSAVFALALVAALGFIPAYIGIWIHGSWTLFAVVAAGGQVLMARDQAFGTVARRLQIGAVGFIASLSATGCGPLGLEAWSNTWRVGGVCNGLIKEWMSPWQLGSGWPAIWFLLTATVIWGIVRDHRVGADQAPHPLKVALLCFTVGAMVAGMTAVRFLILGILACTPILASWWSRPPQWLEWGSLRGRLGERAHEQYWRTITALLVSILLVLVSVRTTQFALTMDPAVAALPRGCNLFSSDTAAKSVEYWRRDVRVWVDGRQDYWGRDRLIATQRYLHAGVSDRVVPEGTTCVLLEADKYRLLARALDSGGDWAPINRSEHLSSWMLAD